MGQSLCLGSNVCGESQPYDHQAMFAPPRALARGSPIPVRAAEPLTCSIQLEQLPYKYLYQIQILFP